MDNDASEPARRPTLQLKGAAAPKAQTFWKCKPCGTAFPLSEASEDEFVRCPACNAKLGKAADFRADPPLVEKLRARPVAAPAPKKTASPRGPIKIEVKRRRLASTAAPPKRRP